MIGEYGCRKSEELKMSKNPNLYGLFVEVYTQQGHGRSICSRVNREDFESLQDVTDYVFELRAAARLLNMEVFVVGINQINTSL